MRYDKGRRDTSRRNITQVAARRFREAGIAATGLTGIMADAGLTNGAFYAHFSSKNDLVREALDHALIDREEGLRPVLAAGGLEAVLRTYLSQQHRDNHGAGCASAALLPDIGRQSAEIRAAYTARLLPFVDTLAAELPQTGEAARRLAFAIYALAIGALQMARAVSDPALSSTILESGISAALKLADITPE